MLLSPITTSSPVLPSHRHMLTSSWTRCPWTGGSGNLIFCAASYVMLSFLSTGKEIDGIKCKDNWDERRKMKISPQWGLSRQTSGLFACSSLCHHQGQPASEWWWWLWWWLVMIMMMIGDNPNNCPPCKFFHRPMFHQIPHPAWLFSIKFLFPLKLINIHSYHQYRHDYLPRRDWKLQITSCHVPATWTWPPWSWPLSSSRSSSCRHFRWSSSQGWR